VGPGSMPMRTPDFRVTLEPVAIDPVTLEELDRKKES